MVETYWPVNHERKLVSGMIDSMHFRILYINREKIVLNVVIYKGSNSNENSFFFWEEMPTSKKKGCYIKYQ